MDNFVAPNPETPLLYYEVFVEGMIGAEWADWFDDMSFTYDAERNMTRLFGALADQAALHGLIAKIRDLGISLVQLRRVDAAAKS